MILYEAPHKLTQTLEDLKDITSSRKIVLARELTKIHEEYISGTAEELLNKVTEPKGEFVIVIEKGKEESTNIFEEMTLEEHYKYYETKGYCKKDIIKQIAKDRKVKKDEIYKKFIN